MPFADAEGTTPPAPPLTHIKPTGLIHDLQVFVGNTIHYIVGDEVTMTPGNMVDDVLNWYNAGGAVGANINLNINLSGGFQLVAGVQFLIQLVTGDVSHYFYSGAGLSIGSTPFSIDQKLIFTTPMDNLSDYEGVFTESRPI